MKIRTIGATAVLALALTACGGSDDEAASAAISKSIMSSSDETFKVNQEQADCVGDGMVEDIGTDKLVEYGLITEDNEANEDLDSVKMSEEDAQSAANVMQECADIREIFTGAMGEVPEETATCIEENLTNEVLHEFLVAVFMDDQQGGTDNLMSALQECMTA